MRAASRLKGTAERTLKEGGSTRAKPLARRREMPERLARVGERPAGAESGGRDTEVLSLERGDLAVREGRARGRGVLEVDLGLERSEGLVKPGKGSEGLVKVKGSEALVKLKASGPLARLEKRVGSTFSLSSSTSSEALRLEAAGGVATAC